MPKRFAGTHRHKVEERGRVSLPSAFRKVLATLDSREIVVIPHAGRDDAHLCLTGPGFEAYCDRVEESLEAAEAQEFLRDFHASAAILEIDDLGRFVMPKKLREGLGIRDACVFTGIGFSFEIAAAEGEDEAVTDGRARTRAMLGRVPMTGLHR
ncbi:MAG: hypothetical protein AAFR52_08715 [Pseudomonadota bacterium]